MRILQHPLRFIFAAIAVASSLWTGSAQETRTITPGQFHALTVPSSMLRVRANTDYYAEAYTYEGRDRSGEFREFDAGDYFDLNASIEFKYGLTDRIEIGLGVPFVSSTLKKNSADRSSQASKTESSGLGNLTLHGGYGMVWNGDSDYLLFQVDLGLPTDTRGNDLFSFGGSLSASVEFEHYWDRFGVTLGLLTNPMPTMDSNSTNGTTPESPESTSTSPTMSFLEQESGFPQIAPTSRSSPSTC